MIKDPWIYSIGFFLLTTDFLAVNILFLPVGNCLGWTICKTWWSLCLWWFLVQWPSVLSFLGSFLGLWSHLGSSSISFHPLSIASSTSEFCSVPWFMLPFCVQSVLVLSLCLLPSITVWSLSCFCAFPFLSLCQICISVPVFCYFILCSVLFW